MGKASKWLKRLFGFKKSEPTRNSAKKRWSFAKFRDDTNSHKPQNEIVPDSYDDEDASRHAMAVAAATAAVAEAAVAAAQAAAAVVKLTSGAGNIRVAETGGGFNSAAVVIQSHYRAYLSRKALRALKAVVKLQALVRGQILRKHYVDKLREMKAIARAQARARAARVLVSYSSAQSSPLDRSGRPMMQEKLDYTTLARSTKQHEQLMMLKKNRSRSNSNVTYDGSEKILETDPWKPKHKHIIRSPNPSHTSDQYCQTVSTSAHQTAGLSPSSTANFTTAENSPLYYSASSMGGSSNRGLFTPTIVTDSSRSYLSCHSDYPSYMAYTQSSKAKVRSLSVPKQRLKYEKSSPVYRYGDSRPNNQRAYSGSGQLDRLGLPIRGDVSGFGGGNWHRY